MKKAVIYARVSTDEQADKGYSLPSQLDACRKYAERLDFEIVAELREDYSGATPIAERPEGKKMVAMLKAGLADAVIVYQVDRLSRDIVNLLTSVQMWTRTGVQVHTCDVGRIENELDIVLVIKGWQGSDERRKIIERTSRGRNSKALAGKVVGNSRPPYGYRFTRDEHNKVMGLEIYEEEAGIVRLMFSWYVDCGAESGGPLSLRAIAAKLEAMKIPTPGEQGYVNRGARGFWFPRGVRAIITSETYAGMWHYGNRKGALKRRTPVDQHITVKVPAIIDRETWDAAQARCKYNKLMAKRNAKREYLLRGLIKCGCGRSMAGKTPHKHIRGYYCNATNYVKPDCDARSVSGDILEAQIWADVKRLFNEIDLEDALRVAQATELDAQEPMRAELEAVEVNIHHAERDADEIAAALPGAKGRVKESLELRMDEVNARYDALMTRRAELHAELGERHLTDKAVEDVLSYAEMVRDGIEYATEADKRRLLEVLGMRINIKHGHYYVQCLLGEWNGKVVYRKRGRPSKNSAIEYGIS